MDKWLKVSEIEDSSCNGLQVEACGDVIKIGFAVDACLEVFEKAKNAGCNLIVVHHGLLWDKLHSITGLFAKRIRFLLQNNIGLYGIHLPLDKHNKLGNNIQLCKLFRLNNIREFGNYRGSNIGFSGERENEVDVEDFVREVEEKLGTKCRLLKFGKEQVKKIGIVSGMGCDAVEEAGEKVDVLLTGESKLSAYHIAKEAKTNVIYAGHYATETLGLKALMEFVKEKFNIQVIFIDNKVDF